MSGGSLDYVCYKVENAAITIKGSSKDPLHIAFSDHLIKVSNALRSMEWFLSGDTVLGDEAEAIRAVVSNTDVLNVCLEQAREAENNLRDAILKAER